MLDCIIDFHSAYSIKKRGPGSAHFDQHTLYSAFYTCGRFLAGHGVGAARSIGKLVKFSGSSGMGICIFWTSIPVFVDGNFCAMGNHHLQRDQASAGKEGALESAQLDFVFCDWDPHIIPFGICGQTRDQFCHS